MSSTNYKYCRTYHLPFSRGLINDDKRIEDEFCFDGKTVEISIKLDGENSSIYNDGYHARSLSSAHHPSRTWLKGFIPTFQHLIPENWRICGENLYAKHSIEYTELETYFYVFNIWNAENYCLSLTDTLKWIEKLSLTKVKTLDILEIKGDDFSKVEKIYNQVVADGEEGIVIRNVESFHYNDFGKNLAKAVRENHVQTDAIHWASAPVIPNKLKRM
jgi:RNA ligase